ncbi:MAG TPA: outer membrane beta-barrel protein [Phnomibacter sp.]|nr:outer membrane beta-barrel protein [Phnomibacter sp.]
MKRKLYQDELEDFLSASAEDLRMYPSSRVWHNIDNKIHGEKKWPALTFAAFLIGAISLAGLILMKPDKDLFKPRHITNTVAANTNAQPQASKAFVVSENLIVANSGKNQAADGDELMQVLMNEQDLATANTVVENALRQEEPTITVNTAQYPQAVLQSSVLLNEEDWTGANRVQSITLREESNNYTLNELPAGINAETAARLSAALPQPQAKSTVDAEALANTVSLKKASKWSLQYYATPSLSYRLLSEVKDVNNTSSIAAPNSLNAMVNHKPKLGLELGSAVMYNVTDYFSVKAGLQLNYRQYAIDAYATPANQPAMIRIDRGNNRFDTIYANNSISNVGPQQNEMQVTNHYFQLAMPVGFELSMATFNTSKFVLAATFQPTYNIGQQSWLISSDYQSYVKQPDLMRKWNFNTGVEAFLRFSNKSGNLNWQVGPQIRYQLLPGAQKKYPVREHLIDYGLKIGVSKTL